MATIAERYVREAPLAAQNRRSNAHRELRAPQKGIYSLFCWFVYLSWFVCAANQQYKSYMDLYMYTLYRMDSFDILTYLYISVGQPVCW